MNFKIISDKPYRSCLGVEVLRYSYTDVRGLPSWRVSETGALPLDCSSCSLTTPCISLESRLVAMDLTAYAIL
jgi:hypothetical protein